jgi:hypothetical protein
MIAATAKAAIRGCGAVLVCALAVVAGLGWLYALRNVHALAVGPAFREALPLQRLAGNDGQSLLRLVLAWFPAGIVAGCGLGALGVHGRAAWAAVLGFALIVVTGAGSDAVTESQRLGAHVDAQLGRAAIWSAAGLLAAGAGFTALASRTLADRSGVIRAERRAVAAGASRAGSRAPVGTGASRAPGPPVSAEKEAPYRTAG